MAMLDKIHDAVKNALIKDGWSITDDPYTINFKGQIVLVDIAAEKNLFTAEKGDEKIAVEVKSFLSLSKMPDLYSALGQYDVYQIYLSKTAPERQLFLAVSDKVYQEFFTQEAIKIVIESKNILFLTVNLAREEIVKWIK